MITGRRAVLALLILGLTVLIAILAGRGQDGGGTESPGLLTGTVARAARTPAEAAQARFVSVFTSGEDGQVTSIMVSSGTEEFNEFARALMDARPVEAVPDESFNVLLIYSFGRDDSLDVSYSPGRNILIIDERAYEPPFDMTPLISGLDQKFDY